MYFRFQTIYYKIDISGESQEIHMPDNSPLTLAELEECRASIIECIGEVEKIADYAEKELRTLKAALMHIEQLIKDFKPARRARKQSAA